jgi:hypothetical protein
MIEPLARLGYASKALIYVIVGSLAVAAAANQGARVTDTSGAFRVILSQPFGHLILIVLSAGLCGYALWRLLDAWYDPDGRGTSAKGIAIRIGKALRGAIYGTFGLEALRVVRGLRGSSGSDAELWTARIMRLPLGDLLVGLAGAIVAVYGAWQLIGAVRHEPDRSLDLSGIPYRMRAPITRISRFGVGARAVIISTVGTLLVLAALRHDPSRAAGTCESILELADAVKGRWVLAAIGVGLIAYGIDQAVQAKCRRIRSVL